MKRTLKERLEAGLAQLGYKRVPERDTTKLRAWQKEGERRVFVGVNGALRAGIIASESYSLSYSPFYMKVLEAGNEGKGLECVKGM